MSPQCVAHLKDVIFAADDEQRNGKGVDQLSVLWMESQCIQHTSILSVSQILDYMPVILRICLHDSVTLFPHVLYFIVLYLTCKRNTII